MFAIPSQKINLIIVLLFSLIFISCNKNKADDRERTSAISVLVGAPIRQSLQEYLELSAEIKSTKEVEISSDVPGKVAAIKKYEGQLVRRGETIALVDRFVIGANYAYATVRTPIAGYVTTTYTTLGASVTAGQPLAKVADINNLEVQIQVPERQVSRIALGQKIFISVSSAPGKEIEATITKRDFSVNTNTRTLMVKGEIDNSDGALLPGMFSDVSILMNSADNILVIPNSSIFLGEDGKSYVYVVVEDNPNLADVAVDTSKKDEEDKKKVYKASVREIDILFPSRDRIAISGGIEDGEEIVMFGREFLKEGSLLNPIRNDSSLSEYIKIEDTNSTNELTKNQVNN